MLIPILFAFTCQTENGDETKDTVKGVKDPHSFAEPLEAVVKHLDLNIKVDFDTKIISGKASWTIENPSKGNEIIFDAKNLKISKVTLYNLG